MIDSFRIKIDVIGEGVLPDALPKNITKKQAIAYINSKRYEDEIKKRLIAQISRYPSNALGKAMKDIDQIVARIRQEIINEKNEERVSQEGRNQEGQGEVIDPIDGN